MMMNYQQRSTLNKLVGEDEGTVSLLPKVAPSRRRTNFDIDNFTLSKSMNAIDTPWSLNSGIKCFEYLSFGKFFL